MVAALRAGAEYAEVPVEKCLLVAGSLSGVSAAEQIGMPCVVLRSRYYETSTRCMMDFLFNSIILRFEIIHMHGSGITLPLPPHTLFLGKKYSDAVDLSCLILNLYYFFVLFFYGGS